MKRIGAGGGVTRLEEFKTVCPRIYQFNTSFSQQKSEFFLLKNGGRVILVEI